MAAAPNSQPQAPATTSSNAQQPSKPREPDDPVTKLKSSIHLLKEVITVQYSNEIVNVSKDRLTTKAINKIL